MLSAEFTAATASIVPEEAQRLTDQELFQQIQFLASSIAALPKDEPIRQAAIGNFHVLVDEALARGVSPAAPGLKFASAQDVQRLHARIDLLVVLLERLLPELNDTGGAVPETVARLRARQLQLPYLLAEEVTPEVQKLDTALGSLDTIARAWQAVPHTDPGNPEIRDGLIRVALCIGHAVKALATYEERDALAKLGEAGTAYVDTMTRVLLGTAAEAQKALRDPGSVRMDEYGFFTQGFGYQWPRLSEEWQSYVMVLFRLQGELRKLGDVGRMASAPLEQRIELVTRIGGDIVSVLQRARAVTLVEAAFLVGGKLLEEVIHDWQQQFKDISIAYELKGVITPLLKELEGGGIPSEESLDAAWSSLEHAQSRVVARLEELEEFRTKMKWFINIASVLVGIGAFRAVAAGLEGVAALRAVAGGAALREGAKAAIKFTISSLAFTSASTVTRGVLTQEWPTPGQFAKQAAFDIATLGLLKGAQGLVGIPYGGARFAPAWQVHGATFGVLWAWSSTWALIESKEEVTFESAVKTIVETGARTALDLAVITTVHKYMTMPRLEGVDASTAIGRSIVVEWDALRGRARAVGRQLSAWRETVERDPVELDRILREAETILGEVRGVYERLGRGEYLTEADLSGLSQQVAQHVEMVRNLSQAGRLGVRATGENSYTYRGDPANLDLFFRRLTEQRLIRSAERVGDTGVFEVRFADGTLRWFAPDAPPPAGRPGRPAAQPTVDLAAETLVRAVPEVPKPVRALALQNLRRLPPAQVNTVVVQLDRPGGAELVRWLARPDVGTALAAPLPVFNADMLARMIRDAAARGQLAPEIATSIQSWNEAWRERVGPDKQVSDFLSFLQEMKSFHGTLDVSSTAEARRILTAFGRRAAAYPWYISTAPPGPSIGPVEPSGPPKPYRNIDDYLIQQGIRHGEFIHARFDEGTWIVRFEQGAPSRAWRFPKSGFPPDRDVDVGSLAGQLRTGVANAEGQAKTEPEAARRTMERLRPVYDQLGFLSRISGASFGDIPELIYRFEGFARDHAIRDWATLRTAERPYTGKFGREEFIQRYVEEGLEFDVETRDWRSAAQQPVAKVRFSEHATLNEALDILLGKVTPPAPAAEVGEPVQPTFKPYFDMLVNEKIATRGQILIELGRIDPRGKTVDNVRHRLKEAYRPWVVDRMVKPNPAQMRAKYADLDSIWDDNPGEALRRASHREMLRLTDPLAPADKGSLGEQWYKLVYRPTAAPHIPITQADVPKGTIELLQERAADFVDGDALREVKRVAGPLEQRDLDQFKDFLGVVELPNGIELDVKGTRTRVTRAVYVFEVPKGVKANAEWMLRQLSRPRRLSFEIFSKSGEMKTITYENRAELHEPALSQWLGLPSTAAP